jgi:multidrug efflux pump subunit AcrA (membrane-fusion protein)
VMAESARTSRRRRARRRRLVAAGVGVAVVGTGTAVAIAATSGAGPNLRVATVRVGSVDQTVETSGTVSSSMKLTPSFATSGTVASVDVTVGQRVTKGQVLAKLDTTALQAELDSANSDLASAKQKLEADETGQTSAGNSGTSGNGSADIVTAAYVTYLAAPSTSISALIKQVEDAQQAVIAAQHDVDTAQQAIDAAQHTVDADVTQNTTLRDAQQQACATSSTPSPAPSDTSTSGGSDCADAMAAYQASADTLAHDMATLDAKIAAQDGYISQLDTAITTLDKLVDQLQSAAANTGSHGGSTGGSSGGSTGSSSPNHNRANGNTPSGSGRSGSTPSGRASEPRGSTGGSPSTGNSASGQQNSHSNGSQNNGSSTSQPASAAQLAADQKAIDAAQAELAVARQDMAAATLTSPAAGKIAEVGLTTGQSSAGGTITIVGTGIPGVEATVVLGQIDQVKVGQSVDVAVDGVSAKLHGTVTSIGLLSTTSGSSTAYPVTVQLAAGTPQLYDGTGADMVIDTGSATNVLTVPTSAIHTTAGGRHTVTVVNGSKTNTVPVTLGVTGSDVAEVKGGLKAGQQVELAEMSEQLPPSTSSSKSGFGFFPRGAGGFFQRAGGR